MSISKLSLRRTLSPSGRRQVARDDRPGWDEYFLGFLPAVASRSTCLRRKVSAVLVRDSRVIGTGYNGTLPGYPHCSDVGCLRIERNIPSGERLDICRAVHAERNAIDYAVASTVGSTLYCTHSPCKFCAERIVTAKVIRVVFIELYPDELSLEILRYSGIALEQFVEGSDGLEA